MNLLIVRKIAGIVLHCLIAGMMILSGVMKVFNLIPKEYVEKMASNGLEGRLMLIGIGELISALLLLIPRTTSLGVLLTSGFWGGVICFHMTHDEGFTLYAVMLALTWVGAGLRNPEMFASFSGPVRGAPKK